MDIDQVELRMLAAADRAVAGFLERLEQAVRKDLPPDDPADDPNPSEELANSIRKDVRRTRHGVNGRLEVDTPYARKQHEAIQFRHPRGGRAKFLEHNLNALGRELAQELASELRRVL